jgi:hypothetical protein
MLEKQYYVCWCCGEVASKPVIRGLSPMQQKIFHYIWDHPRCKIPRMMMIREPPISRQALHVHLAKIKEKLASTPFRLQSSRHGSGGYTIGVIEDRATERPQNGTSIFP